MRKEHAVCGGLGQKRRLGEGVGGKGLEGLRRHLGTPGWVDVAGQSWPGSLALLEQRTEPPRSSLRCTLHGPTAARPVADPSGIDGLEQLRVGAGERQALTQPSLRGEGRQMDRWTDRQTATRAGVWAWHLTCSDSGVCTAWPDGAFWVQRGSLSCPSFPQAQQPPLCRPETQGGQSAGAQGQCRGEESSPQRTHSAPESDLQPTHPFSGLRLPWGWLGTQALMQLPGPGEGLRAEAEGSRKGPMSAWKLRGPASPCPGQASPCQDGARQASPSLQGRNRVRLSGKRAQLGCVDGSSSNRQAVMPTLLREPPAESRSLGLGKSHALSSQTSLWRFREEGAVSRSLGCSAARPDSKPWASRS